MTTIEVVKLVGPVCVDPNDASNLCWQLNGAMETNDEVCVDFTGVTALTTSFLRASFGCLLGSFNREQIAERLVVRGLDKTDSELFNLVVEGAAQYYSQDAYNRAAIDQATNDPVKTC